MLRVHGKEGTTKRTHDDSLCSDQYTTASILMRFSRARSQLAFLDSSSAQGARYSVLVSSSFRYSTSSGKYSREFTAPS